tara:strand:- start:11441 stop:11593 length:153 start_codon:yes stop_codon:yes gene_type:complete
MIKPEWHFMKDKKYSTDQRIKRVEKAIGELYVMIHHIAERLEPKTDNKEE